MSVKISFVEIKFKFNFIMVVNNLWPKMSFQDLFFFINAKVEVVNCQEQFSIQADI